MYDAMKSREMLEAEKVLVEVFRITKLTNQSSMIGVAQEDLEYLAKRIAQDYLEPNLQTGLTLLKEAIEIYFRRAQTDGKIAIGEFIRICSSLKSQEREQVHSQQLLGSGPRISNEQRKEYLKEIKAGLSKCIRPLPYDKNVRVK